MLSFKERHDIAEKTVSKLNNYLEEHQNDEEFRDLFMKDIVDEAGFGYSDDDLDTLRFIDGEDISDSQYSMLSAYNMIKDGVTTPIVFELFKEN